MKSDLHVVFFICDFCFLFPFGETFAYHQVMKIFSNVFFENFIVSAFVFSSMIHLKLILVRGVRCESGLIFFPDEFLFHYLSKRFFFPHWVALLLKSNPVSAGLFLRFILFHPLFVSLYISSTRSGLL